MTASRTPDAGSLPLPDEPDEPAEVPLPKLSEPADGIPAVIGSERELAECAAAIAGGVGPVALDAERASGYRYGQRAYLVQVRREGSGTWLIDPIQLPDLTPLDEAIGSAEWLLHAASQDLACLAEVGLRPRQLFDTELGGRLLGLPRVGLAAVVEHYLGVTLAKEHSAVDWSTRPLPEPWLRYAALDVEVLAEVRNLMGIDLARAGKSEWARQEFEALLTWEPTVKVDPWRRTSGTHRLRKPRAMAAVRESLTERASQAIIACGLVALASGLLEDSDDVVGRCTAETELEEAARAFRLAARGRDLRRTSERAKMFMAQATGSPGTGVPSRLAGSGTTMSARATSYSA